MTGHGAFLVEERGIARKEYLYAEQMEEYGAGRSSGADRIQLLFCDPTGYGGTVPLLNFRLPKKPDHFRRPGNSVSNGF